VVVLGAVSFFADVSSEMVYPLIPIFLTRVLGAPVAAVGLIEGVAEGTASLLRLVSGWWSDRAQKRLPLVFVGYGLAALGKLLLAGAGAWPLVFVARFVDRFGKGVRGSPRDALIADSTPEAVRGRAYGLHRSMDTAGAVVGPLLALALAALLDDRLRLVFLIAVIPGVLGVLALGLVREPARAPARDPAPVPIAGLGSLDPRLRWFLAASAVFALVNSSDVFLLLRASDLGLSTTAVVLAYVVYNFVYMLSSYPAGIAADRLGRRSVFILGLLVFALVYAGFALATDAWQIWPLFACYGLYIALTEGVSRALVASLAPTARRASVLGLHGMVTGFGVLIASIVAGQLWDRVGMAAPFALGATGAVIAALMLLVAPARFSRPISG